MKRKLLISVLIVAVSGVSSGWLPAAFPPTKDRQESTQNSGTLWLNAWASPCAWSLDSPGGWSTSGPSW